MRRGGFSVTKTLHQSFNCRLLKSTISYLKSNEGGAIFFFKVPAGASTSRFCRLVGSSVKENVKKCGKCQISQKLSNIVKKVKKSVKKCQEKG